MTHLDSAGLGALVGVWSSARRKSAEVGFRWPEPHGAAAPYEVKLVHFNDYIRKLLRITFNDYIRKLLRITRLDKLFGIPDELPHDER